MRRGALNPKSIAVVAALVAIVALFPMVVAFACTALARFALSPGSGLVGDTIAVTNTGGFQSSTDPVSKVVLRWNSSGGPILWSGPPNSDGTLPAITFQVPSVSPGDGYTVIAYPYGADGNLMMNGNSPPTPIHSNAPFTVTAPPPAQSSAPAAQAPVAAVPAPAQASNSAGASQAEPPVAAAPVAPAPAAVSGPVGNVGNQQPVGSTKPSAHSPTVSAKPRASSSGGIAILALLVVVVVATAALVMLGLRRRRVRRQPPGTQPAAPAPLPRDDRVSKAADLSGHAVELAHEPSRAGDLVGATRAGQPTDE